MLGIVKFFDENRGFGFIKDANGNDFFVHYSSINKSGYKSLTPDQKVSFDESENEKGRCAINVELVEE